MIARRYRQGKRACAFLALILSACLFPACTAEAADRIFLRIYDWRSGELYREMETSIGAELFFGWIHSLEKIPWNEYFHIDENCDLILDAITFPAFGAGIPENKGRVCYVKDGLIHMEEIDQRFAELVWLNSSSATRDIRIDDVLVARGSELPHHARLRLVIERGDMDGSKR